jgi:hypothetical protein
MVQPLDLQGRHLVLIKSVLEVILVYWHLMAQIPKGILTWIRKYCFNYLWKSSLEYKGLHLVSWKCLTKPKECGGWGLKDGVKFGQALAAKSLWVFLTQESLWKNILIALNILFHSQLWIGFTLGISTSRPHHHSGGLSLNPSLVIGKFLARKVGNGV